MYAGGLHEARARTFPPSSTLSQRRRLEVAAQGVTGEFVGGAGREREGEGDRREVAERRRKKKKEKICRANSRAR